MARTPHTTPIKPKKGERINQFAGNRKNSITAACTFDVMKETTLGQVKTGGSFWFGGYEFIKTLDSEKDEIFQCQIPGQHAYVHITRCAWVSAESSLIKQLFIL